MGARIKIGIAQLNSNDDFQRNFSQIKKIILEAQHEKPAAIFFPENSIFMRVDSDSGIKAISLQDEMMLELKEICTQTQISIHLTTPILEDGKFFNASVWIDAKLGASIVYRKMHLFDIELIGERPIRESDVFTNGEKPTIFNINNFKVGSSICYDIRFAELYSTYAKAEVDVILVPAAFLVKTGRAHWEVLLRARAIESQCYVVASAQSGLHQSSSGGFERETFGHSMIINPWGEVMAFKANGVGVFFAELSQELLLNVRKQIPMKNHRRIDF